MVSSVSTMSSRPSPYARPASAAMVKSVYGLGVGDGVIAGGGVEALGVGVGKDGGEVGGTAVRVSGGFGVSMSGRRMAVAAGEGKTETGFGAALLQDAKIQSQLSAIKKRAFIPASLTKGRQAGERF